MNRPIYITGSNGFIGQNLTNYLSDNNFNIHALIRNKSIPKFKLKSNINIHYGDLLDSKSLISSIPQGSIIVNLAANPYHPKLSYAVNVQGTKNLLNAARTKKICKFIQISTMVTKIRHKGNYAKSKLIADDLVINSGLPYVILKPSLVYGPGDDGLFNKLKKLMSKSLLLPIFGDGTTKLYPILVSDFCFFIERIICDQSLSNKTFDVGSAKSISYNDFYKRLITTLNLNTKIIHLPISLGILLSYPLQYLPKPPFNIDNILGSTQNVDCHPLGIIKRYKHTPLDLEHGLKEIIKNPKINVAIIGFGKMGILHSTILKTFPNVHIAAVVEQNNKATPTIKSMLNTDVYPSLEEALTKINIDAVFICTPTFTHFDLIKVALKHKVKIFVEKPASLNLSEVKFLENVSTGRDIHVGYTLLFSRTFIELKKIIERKAYGEIKSFKGYCKQSEVLSPKKGWPYQKKLSGGGVLMNPGPHLFSLVCWYFGTPAVQTSSTKSIYSNEVEDKATIQLAYKKFKGVLSLNWSRKNQLIPKTYMIIEFQKATIYVDDSKIEILRNSQKKVINRQDLRPQLNSIFNINPDSFGESYYIEDWLFINSFYGKTKHINDISFANITEKMILNSYRQND